MLLRRALQHSTATNRASISLWYVAECRFVFNGYLVVYSDAAHRLKLTDTDVLYVENPPKSINRAFSLSQIVNLQVVRCFYS